MASVRHLVLVSAAMLVFLLSVELSSVEACTTGGDFTDLSPCAGQTTVTYGDSCCKAVEQCFSDDPDGTCLCGALSQAASLGITVSTSFVTLAVQICLPGQTVNIPSCA